MTTNEHRLAPWIITGMHRGGASLAAACMQGAGVHIGSDLIGPAPGNPRGLFENREFVEFHKSLLKSAGWDTLGWGETGGLRPGDAERAAGGELLVRNAVDGHWGWKDPRSTLFLDLWHDLAPNARFIFIYRAPWDVIDSLYRRGADAIVRENPLVAVRMWQDYACRMLSFHAQHPDRCLFCQASTIAGNPALFNDALSRIFGVSLSFPTEPDIKAEEMQSVANARLPDGHHPSGNLLSGRAALLAAHFPETIETFRQMIAHEKNAIPASPVNAPEIKDFPVRQIFQDWQDIRALTRQTAALQEEAATAWASRDKLQFDYSTASALLTACRIELTEYQRLLREMDAQCKILQHRARRQKERLARKPSAAQTRRTMGRWLNPAPAPIVAIEVLKTAVYAGRNDLSRMNHSLIDGVIGLANRHELIPEIICKDGGPLLQEFESHGIPVAIRDDAMFTRASTPAAYENALQMLAAELAGRECNLVVALSIRSFYAIEAARRADIPALWFFAMDEGPEIVDSLEDITAVVRSRIAGCYGLPYRLVVPRSLVDTRCWPTESPLGNLLPLPAADQAEPFLRRYAFEAQCW